MHVLENVLYICIEFLKCGCDNQSEIWKAAHMQSKVKRSISPYRMRIFYRPLAGHVLITELSRLLRDTAEWPHCSLVRRSGFVLSSCSARMQVDDPARKAKLFSRLSVYHTTVNRSRINERNKISFWRPRARLGRTTILLTAKRGRVVFPELLSFTKKRTERDQAVFFILTGSRNALQYLIPRHRLALDNPFICGYTAL